MSVRAGRSSELSPFIRSALVATCVMTVLGASIGTAVAEDETGDPLGALADVTAESSEPATDVLADVAQVPTTDTGATAVDVSLDGTDVVVPTDPSDPLTLDSSTLGTSVEVTLPFAEQADAAEVESPGIVSYDNGNGTTTVPVVKEDGALQITTVIADRDAPSRFDYVVSLDEGSQMVIDGEGVVQILDPAGAMTAGFAPAWAKDANGVDVPTHYEVAGSTLTQVVDHSWPDLVYPVVADPFLGINLLAGVWKNRPGGYSYGNGNQWSTRLSPWGMAVWTGAGSPFGAAYGNSVVRTKGWDEFVSRGGSSLTTVRQQYECHVVFGYAVWLAGFWWDFETARPTNSRWLTNPQRCNFT
jgi:hypothetical protein